MMIHARKSAVGELWAKKSGGNYLFLMAMLELGMCLAT
jgi:hypothetical protein